MTSNSSNITLYEKPRNVNLDPILFEKGNILKEKSYTELKDDIKNLSYDNVFF